MHINSLVNHCSELLRLILKSEKAPDTLAALYLRQKKHIGASDRRFISETTFACLRCLYTIQYCIDGCLPLQADSASRLYFMAVAALLIGSRYPGEMKTFHPESLAAFATGGSPLEKALAEALAEKYSIDLTAALDLLNTVSDRFLELDAKASQISEAGKFINPEDSKLFSSRCSVSEIIIEKWLYSPRLHRSLNEIMRLCQSLKSAAPLCLRVNRIAATRREVADRLGSLGIETRLGQLSEDCLIIDKRIKLSGTGLYKGGLIEIQDEGSQVISLTMQPGSRWKVLDACAGAGGKSLHIASLQADRGKIISVDIEPAKLRELQVRARRAGINSISPVLFKNPKQFQTSISSAVGKSLFDAVLVDAPCSGTGTVRRNPLPKYRLNAKLLGRLQSKQNWLLDYYSRFVAPGGVLLYSTCSLMDEENDAVVEAFLGSNPEFCPDPIKPALQDIGINLNNIDDRDFKLSLDPAIHGCDGFFVSRMQRMK